MGQNIFFQAKEQNWYVCSLNKPLHCFKFWEMPVMTYHGASSLTAEVDEGELLDHKGTQHVAVHFFIAVTLWALLLNFFSCIFVTLYDLRW